MKKTSGSKALLKLGAKKCQNSEKKTTFFSLKKSLKTRKIVKKRKKNFQNLVRKTREIEKNEKN